MGRRPPVRVLATGEFWDGTDMYAAPFELELELGEQSAVVRIDRLGPGVGRKIAYVFDFGDEWRARLAVAKLEDADDDPYPRVLASRGDAPPQYGYVEELDEDAA